MTTNRWLTAISASIMNIAAAFLLFSCAYETPRLDLQVNEIYETSNIEIRYSFYGESDYQRCRVTVDKVTYSSEIRVYSREEHMPNEGTIDLNLGEGTYRIRFSVLSNRGWRNEVIASLDETKEFTVHTSGM